MSGDVGCVNVIIGKKIFMNSVFLLVTYLDVVILKNTLRCDEFKCPYFIQCMCL